MTTRTSHPILRRVLLVAIATASLLAGAAGIAAAETSFTFNGGGWGHGIGLSQYGARGYAEGGKTYDWILAHYYQGTRLANGSTSLTVRVNIDDNAGSRSAWQVRAGTTSRLVVYQVSNSSVYVPLDATSRYWIVTSNSNTAVHRDQTYTIVNANGTTSIGHRPGTLVKRFAGACNVKSNGNSGAVTMLTASGPFNQAGITWRGYLRFTPNTSSTSKVVNFVNIEQYLYGVVPRESPSGWHPEALKAQAVAARSYVYQDAKEARTIYCTTMSQVYNGASGPGAHEVASTTKAVNDTRGKVVWYGTETQPVKTFFSSSSGGHTASIQDVWTSSSPRPYYTGVADADTPTASGNPNYRWSVTKTATEVSSLLRAKDAALSADFTPPSPYKVTGIFAERATSGYAHHVSVRWSNGLIYRITGDTMRSALGLRSSKFTAAIVNPPVYKYEENNTNFAWHGQWYRAASTAPSGGAMAHTNVARSQFIAKFDGTGFSWYGSKARGYGIAEVYIDGSLAGTIDLYSSRTAYQSRLFSKSGLADRSHTVIIRVTGKKNPSSLGATVAVDRFDVTGLLTKATAPVSQYEQDNGYVAQFGEWVTPPAVNPGTNPISGGTFAYSVTNGSEMQVRFVGSGVRWIGTAAR